MKATGQQGTRNNKHGFLLWSSMVCGQWGQAVCGPRYSVVDEPSGWRQGSDLGLWVLSLSSSLSPLSHPSLISLPSSFPSPLLHVSVPLFLYRFPFPFFGSSPLLAWFPGWRFSSRSSDWAAAKIDLVRAVCWPAACGSNLHLHHFVHPLLLYTCVCVCLC